MKAQIENVFRVVQRSKVLLTFVLNGQQMFELCEVHRFADGNGVQRGLNKSHANAIAANMEADDYCLLAENIVGNLKGEWKYNQNTRTLQYEVGNATIDLNDGQHRYFGLAELSVAERKKWNYVFTCLLNGSEEESLGLFRQQRMRRPIARKLDLAQQHAMGQWDDVKTGECYRLALRLNDDENSALKGMIIFDEGVRPSNRGKGKGRSQVTLDVAGTVGALKPSRSGKSIIAKYSEEEWAELVFTTIGVLPDLWPNAWGSNAHVLTTTKGIKSVLNLFVTSPAFAGAVGGGKKITPAKVRSVLNTMPPFQWHRGQYANATDAELTVRLDKALRTGLERSLDA